jgi:pilus assembly protein CpaF
VSLRERSNEAHLASAVDNDGVAYMKTLLLQEVDLAEMSSLGEDQKRARLERIVGHLLTREGPLLNGRERQSLVRRVVDEALGLGILEPLLRDDSITEILVNGTDKIYVERAGKLQLLPLRFSSDEQLLQTIDRIVAGVNRRVDESSPMVDARLPTGERVNVILPPLAVDGPTLTIRRFPQPYTMAQLVSLGAVDDTMAQLLAACIRARLNVIVSGGTGSGKTTMLNAVSAYIGEHERIITIEDAAELSLQQSHVVRLESRPPNVEGRGAVEIRDLVRNALRMRPDRIIVGETRSGEALDMLQAMNTGHEGSLATIHANSPIDAMLRLETLATMSELNLPTATLRDQINSAVDVVVQLSRLPDGSRRVVEVATLVSRHSEDYRLEPLVRFEPDPYGGVGRVTGHNRFGSLPADLLEKMRLAGQQVPPPLLGAAP